MIVADTNIIAYLLMPGDHTEKARAVFKKDPAWHAPLLWRSEFENVLATAMRVSQLPLREVIELMALAEELLLEKEHLVRSDAVLARAQGSGRSAYDCEFVVLAESLGLRLVTEDKALLLAFPQTALSMAAFLV